jgi:hypothetical protein
VNFDQIVAGSAGLAVSDLSPYRRFAGMPSEMRCIALEVPITGLQAQFMLRGPAEELSNEECKCFVLQNVLPMVKTVIEQINATETLDTEIAAMG